ncbi:NAD+ synthase [bacterium]|nr:NAD+ synthase [bacterium]
MKIALAQINTRTGDLDNNADAIIRSLRQAENAGADLVVFPELTITGYPPEDLVEKRAFVKKNLAVLERIARETKNTGVIIGFAYPNESGKGHPVFNSAALMDHGQIVGIQHKTLLPNYDVFDEMRHFEPAVERKTLTFRGKKIGVSICEDAWNDKDFWKHPLYPNDPVEELARQKCDVLINISASPFSIKKNVLRLNMFKNIAVKYRLPVVMVNLIGGNDSLIFDGCSFVLDADGNILAQAKAFEEDFFVVDLDKKTGIINAWDESEEKEITDALVLGVRDYLRKCHFNKAIIGLSGGIDSALVAAITTMAIGKDKVIGVAMPSRYSSDHSVADARQLAQNLGIEFRLIPIEPMFKPYLEGLSTEFKGMNEDITEENLQARIRGNILMALSNKFNAIVLSTGNKSELAVGYCTIYGDMCGGLAVISDIPKTMVYQIARWINREREIIPHNTIDKAPSAELRPDQTDQDSLPPYDVLDGILKAYIEDLKEYDEIVTMGFKPEVVDKVLKLVDRNEYKRRQAAPGLRVTSKAFGFGRRLPIAQGWR